MTESTCSKPCGFGLLHDAWGRLVLIDAEGERHVEVTPVRAFPLSDREHWISICDAEGNELVSIEDAASLPEQVRQVLEDDLAQREFLPVLRRIVRVFGSSEPCEWDVETDRGRTRFVLKSEDDVRRLGPHRAIIVDAQGVRYLVTDARALDAASRRVLEQYL